MDIASSLHAGVKPVLMKLAGHELDVAKAIAAGDLTSPQMFHNVALFAIRITGTGAAFRQDDGFVYRVAENYLNDDFLARCNGLPVIFEHPDKKMLNSEEFADRVVGTILLPYLKRQEVWGIAKIYDDSTIRLLEHNKMSTSPNIVIKSIEQNKILELNDGTSIVVEGKPYLLDHIAICELGVWDKAGEPSGVISEPIGASTMDEDEKAKADAEATPEVKTDEGGDTSKLDKILEVLGAVTTRLDALESAKADNLDEGASVADAEKDIEREDATARAKEDVAKADADREIREKLADIEQRIPKELSDEDYTEMANIQAKADSVMSGFGKQAPRPLQGESARAYRSRLASSLKNLSESWKSVDLNALPDSAFGVAETQIYADAVQAARNPVDIAAGTLRAIKRRGDSGHTITEYVGSPSAWLDQFGGGRAAVRKINTNVGRDH